MPILFVHGVSSRMEQGHKETWIEIKKKLRDIVAPLIAKDGKGEGVWIEEAYWGDDSVDFAERIRRSLPDQERIKKLTKAKGSWLGREIKKFKTADNKLDSLKDFFNKLLERGWNLTGDQVTRLTFPVREKLNEDTTLFLGDIFFYLSRRGEVDNPGAITKELLSKLKEAQKNKVEKDNEPLIVFSHSMGGQLVYDMVSYYLPEMLKKSEYKDCQEIYIDFWVAAASQVGLFKEMKVFKEDENSTSASIPVNFPSKHLGIWWNLWDCNDYLSFTVEPFIKDVFDDMYDSGNAATTAHTVHFDDSYFYEELALHIREAKKLNLGKSNWEREAFIKSHKTEGVT